MGINKKISLIGAGSGCFSKSIVSGLCKSKALSGCLVSLMDIDEARLNAVYTICVRINRFLGGNLRFEKTTDRAVTLQDADIVINTALAAPHTRLVEGWEIAKKYGFRFGGSYHVMYDEAFWVNFYQLRLMEDITRDMQKYCPNAWHLMVANPVVAGTTYLQRKYPDIKMVGLCHGYQMIYQICTAMGIPHEDVTYQIPGVNHFVWLNEARVNGEPMFPMIDKWLEENGEEYAKTCIHSACLCKKRMDFYKKHGVIPIGDTMSWTGASWPWWYHSDDEVEKSFHEYSPADGWYGYFSRVQGNADEFIIQAQKLEADENAAPQGIGSDDLVVPLVEALAGGRETTRIVNVLNKGQLVPGLPEDFEVEVPALCNADGVHPVRTSPLPKPIIAHTLRDRVAPVEMELAAYESGDINLLRELVLMDKWATSMDQVSAFIDEILDLPYHKEMKEHFKR